MPMQPGQFLELGAHLGIVVRHVFGNGPDAGRRHAGGQDEPIAIQNAPPVGGQLKRARKAHLALALEKFVANHLHIGRAPARPGKAQGTIMHQQ
jgi:hypothetical protein